MKEKFETQTLAHKNTEMAAYAQIGTWTENKKQGLTDRKKSG